MKTMLCRYGNMKFKEFSGIVSVDLMISRGLNAKLKISQKWSVEYVGLSLEMETSKFMKKMLRDLYFIVNFSFLCSISQKNWLILPRSYSSHSRRTQKSSTQAVQ